MAVTAIYTVAVAAVKAYGAYALAAAAAYTTYSSSQQQKAQQEAYNQNLRTEAMRQYRELDQVEEDILHESYAQSMQAQRDFMQARSSIELQSAASGTGGQSIDIALNDLNVGLGQRMAEITENRARNFDAVDNAALAAQSGAKNASVSISQPSYYQAFAAGLGTYSTVSNLGSQVGQGMEQARTVKIG